MQPITRLVVLLTLWVMAAAPVRASAQTTPSREEILRRIAALEAQIAELRALVEARQPAEQNAGGEREQAATDFVRDLKFGTVLDTYYGFNFNRPIGRVNLLRAYDVTSNNFSLNQASIAIESVPNVEAGRRFGGRLDLQYGQATETLQGSLANEPRPWVYRNVFQAYGTFVAPIGSGLAIDFGKWASSLGYENNYTKDQINYSRSYWFNFLPFYHMGARVNYKLNDLVALNYWITNGTEQTEAFNNFKDQFAGVDLHPSSRLSWTANYYLGQEHPDVQTVAVPTEPSLPTQAGLSVVPVRPYYTGKLQIFDTYASWELTPTMLLAFEGDLVTSQNPGGAAASLVTGGAAYLRHQLTPKTSVAVRGEYLRDRNGLFSGVAQSLKEATLTYDVRVNDGFLVRTEWRRDFSNRPFFLTDTPERLSATQDTATLGLVWWWGTKRGVW